uniref:Uncharacterized protein n=1 Tax=Anguilla anguilla TaxID=7936 RepID=A0A0E9Y297_ANGAN
MKIMNRNLVLFITDSVLHYNISFCKYLKMKTLHYTK